MNNSQSSRRLSQDDINAFLALYQDPADAKQFLIDAGFIDEQGELTGPYALNTTQLLQTHGSVNKSKNTEKLP